MQITNLVWMFGGILTGASLAWFVARLRMTDLGKSVLEAREREEEANGRAERTQDIVAGLNNDLRTALSEKGRLQSEAGRAAELREAVSERDRQIQALNDRIAELNCEKATAEAGQQAANKRADEMVAQERDAQARIISAKDEQISKLSEFIQNAESALTKEFKVLSGDVLREASAHLLRATDGIIKTHEEQSLGNVKLHKEQIEGMLKPVGDSLERLDKHVKESEEARQRAETLLNDQVQRLAGASESLTSALRKPVVRGSWGEMTLENALGNAGLVADVDYVLQHSTDGEDGRKRTDAVVNLPKGRKLIIDSKNLMETFISLSGATDDGQRAIRSEAHSRSLRNHMKDLASKKYWERYEGLDCVILFIPDDSMYHAAIRDEAELIRDACENRVFIANPMSLIPLLKAVSYVLDQEKSNKSASEIREVARELYSDIARFAEHMATIGNKIEGAVKAYNAAIPTLDRNIVAKSRRLRALGSSKGEEAELPEAIELSPRLFSSPELRITNHLLEEPSRTLAIAASAANADPSN